MKILVLGATGLIGSAVARVLAQDTNLQIFGTIRAHSFWPFPSTRTPISAIRDLDVLDNEALATVIADVHPDVIVNCVGATKHKPDGNDPIKAIKLNALLPHRLAIYSAAIGARLIHVSTDCVFSGKTGNYSEDSATDAQDVYGQTKALGEIRNRDTVTLRTSTIGHEFGTKFGLLEWFLSQKTECQGYRHAIFSGLPTVILARVIRDYVLPNTSLKGIYNVAGFPIAKYELLKIIAHRYGKAVEIQPDDTLVIDRSLDARKFIQATGFVAPSWEDAVQEMWADKLALGD